MHLGSEAKPSTKHEVLLSMLATGLLEERQFSECQGSNEAPVSRRKPDRTFEPNTLQSIERNSKPNNASQLKSLP